MELTVGNRFRLLAILPESGNIVTLKIVAELRKALALSEEEIKKFGVTFSGDRITWKDQKDTADIAIGPVAKGVITDNLERLNNEEKLKIEDVELWELFMEGENES
jgi:hypothetical protein